MIGLDTNVLVRHLAQDDLVQSAAATTLLEERLGPTNPGFISVVAMAETAWVLQRSFGLAGTELADVLELLLRIQYIQVQFARQVMVAIVAVRAGSGSFSDALIAALGREAGCRATATFDLGALRMPDFTPVT